MTSPYTSSCSAPSITFRVARALFALLIAAGTVVGALFVAWIAVITWSGCFIECSGSNHVAGAALGAGALATLVAGVATIRALYGRSRQLRAAAWTVVGGLVALFMVFGLT